MKIIRLFFCVSVTYNIFDMKNLEIYHKTFSGAVAEAIAYAEQRSFVVDTNDVWNQISTGPKKPDEGKTNKYHISLTREGLKAKRTLCIQIYGMKETYELNCYIS